VKEIDLLSLAEIPTNRIAHLPYVLITNDLHIIPPSTLQTCQWPLGIQISKYFYLEDIEDLKKEIEMTKVLGDDNGEVIRFKELESRSKSRIENSSKWAEWAAELCAYERSEGDSRSVTSLQSKGTDLTIPSINPAGPGGAAEEIADLFEHDPEIRELISKGFRKMEAERFERNLRRLLKDFAVNLRIEAKSALEKGATKLVHNYRAYVTRLLHEKLAEPDQNRWAEAFHKLKDQDMRNLRKLRLERWERFLSDMVEPIVRVDGEDLDNESDNGSGFSDDEQDLPNLEKVKDFMVSSEAFLVFTKSLHDFVNSVATQRSIASKPLSHRDELAVDLLNNTGFNKASVETEQARPLYETSRARITRNAPQKFEARDEIFDDSDESPYLSDEEDVSNEEIRHHETSSIEPDNLSNDSEVSFA
jgi:hypothetical protein